MDKHRLIGTALGLALCSAALSGCNFNNQNSDQSQSQATNASTADIDGTWKSETEQQLREAIANAPANGLKPELFLKGGEKGPALTQAALKYASALANGYSDPAKLHEVYTIPHQMVDVRAGLQQAIQKGDVKGWLDSLAPQTDEYRALSQAHLRFLKLAATPVPARVGRQADQARQPRSASGAGGGGPEGRRLPSSIGGAAEQSREQAAGKAETCRRPQRPSIHPPSSRPLRSCRPNGDSSRTA